MSADSAQHDLLHYLTCDLPLGYPLKTPVTRLLDPKITFSTRRELLHQQSRFLDLAKSFLETQPWIAYLAATKHEAVLVTIPTYASQLVDIIDIAFFHELQEKAKALREASRAAIDEPTAQACDRLILLQSEASQIEDARKSFGGALQAGFKAVEPLPPPPPEPMPQPPVLPSFIAAGVACLVLTGVMPSDYGGMAWGLAGLLITAMSGAWVIWKGKPQEKVDVARFKAHLIHEHYFALCRKSVALVLALPFETRRSALVDLAPCLGALDSLLPERENLEARYIKPFFRT